MAEINQISSEELTHVAEALNTQVKRDFGPSWGVQSRVFGFTHGEEIPDTFWPIYVREHIDVEGLGYHSYKDEKAFAVVKLTNYWTLTASHQCLDMLASPFGNHFIQAPSVRNSTKTVAYINEVCDPCEDFSFAYMVDGVTVSDFITPQFYDTEKVPNNQYDFVGHIKAPLDILKGGYISWLDPATNHLEQQVYFEDEKRIRDLGEANEEANAPSHVIKTIEEADRSVGLRGSVGFSRLIEALKIP